MKTNFFQTKVTGNSLLEDCSNFLLSPVYHLFNARSVYKINNSYFIDQKIKKSGFFLTTLKIILIIPLFPIISIGIILKDISKLSPASAKTCAILEDYDNQTLKTHRFCKTKFGHIDFIGAQSNLYSDFLTTNSFNRWYSIHKIKGFIYDSTELNLNQFNDLTLSLLLTTKKLLKLETVTLGKHPDICKILDFLFRYAPNLKEIELTSTTEKIPVSWIKLFSHDASKIKNLNAQNIGVSSLDYEALESFFSARTLPPQDKIQLLKALWPVRSRGIHCCYLNRFSADFFTSENITAIAESLSDVEELTLHPSFKDPALCELLFKKNTHLKKIDASHVEPSKEFLDTLGRKHKKLKEISISELDRKQLNRLKKKFPKIKRIFLSHTSH